jgi:photosystem II stability/assembly factor-like uncharacterized protein
MIFWAVHGDISTHLTSRLYSSRDGGRTWSTLTTLDTPQAPVWWAGSADSAYVLNADGSRLLITTDGGRTWTPLPFG